LKQDSTVQIRINSNIKKLIKEELGSTSISDYIRNSLNNVLVTNKGWKLDEHR